MSFTNTHTTQPDITKEQALTIFSRSKVAANILPCISIADFLALIEEYGGCYLYIPTKKRTQLAAIVSEKSLNNLANLLRVDRILMPKLDSLTRWFRDIEICRNPNDPSQRDMAIKYRLTIHRISQITAKNRNKLGAESCR